MNPHFWPKSFQVPHETSQVESNRSRAPASVELVGAEPSIARSEWKLVSKAESQRTYLLTIKDREGKVIETVSSPEMLLEGDVLLNKIENAGIGKWKVTFDFPGDQSVIRVGFRIGEYRVDHFRRIHWQLSQVDRMLSAAFTNKVRLRSDGSDGARVYVHLRDPQNFPIYQFHDFELKLRILTGKVSVEGPFSSLTGPYFLVKGSEVGKVKMEAWIDGERLVSQLS